MPPSTNEGPDLRRASLDSEASIFSHFSLTPESEATLRAWEQTMLSSPTATSSPSPSPSKLTKATDKLTSRRWVVFIGRNPGVYTSSESAREQTTGIPNAINLAYPDAASAERDFERFSSDGILPPYGPGPWVVFAGRTTGVFTELGAVKASIDGYPTSNFMACSTIAAANEVHQTYTNLSSKRADPPYIPTTTTTSITNTSGPSSEPIASGSGGGEATDHGANPMQPFSLDASVSDLAGHECYWVTWAAVRPGVFFGMDALMAAQPMAGGYAAVEDQAEGFALFHLLVRSRLIRKLRTPPS